jgi:hypothetical protein
MKKMAVGAWWKEPRTLSFPERIIIWQRQREIGDFIVACRHKVGELLAGGCQAQDPDPSWRGVCGRPAVVDRPVVRLQYSYFEGLRACFSPLSGVTPPPPPWSKWRLTRKELMQVQPMIGDLCTSHMFCQSHSLLSHRCVASNSVTNP